MTTTAQIPADTDDPILKRPRVLECFARARRRYGVTPAEIRGPGMQAQVIKARWYIIAQLYTPRVPGRPSHNRYSQPQVGRVINRHHTTVCHALHRMSAAARAAVQETPGP